MSKGWEIVVACNDGTIEEVRERSGKVRVRYDDGTLVSVGYSFVSLVGEEA